MAGPGAVGWIIITADTDAASALQQSWVCIICQTCTALLMPADATAVATDADNDFC